MDLVSFFICSSAVLPTMALGERLYFGNDRLELLELHLNGVAPPGET